MAVTAVLVGQLASPADCPDDLTKWPAVRLVPALSFATGTFVGTTWAEFRDAEAGLVTRHHRYFGRHAFETGHRTIIEKFDRGTGNLLTLVGRALKSENFDPTMAMLYAVKSGQKGTVEDKLRTVSNSVECLSSKGDLLLTSLDARTLDAVKEIAREAADRIRLLASALESSADAPPERVAQCRMGLEAVANIIRAVPDKRREDFGSKVTNLLAKYCFDDAAIADEHYRVLGALSGDAKSWVQMINKYRNKVDHLGYFDFAGGQYDSLQVKGVADHLHDIVIRVILKKIGYGGCPRTYQTPLSRSLTCMLVEWATPLTLSNMLRDYARVGA